MLHLKKCITLLIGLLSITFVAPGFAVDKPSTYVSQSLQKGHAVTGWNQRLGQTVAEMPIIGWMSFPINGVCGERFSTVIDANTPLDARLCTHADPLIYKVIFNVDVTSEFPLNQNIALSDFPQIYRSTGESKTLKPTLETPWYEPANGSISKNYRVKDWLKAEGSIRFVCTGRKNYYEIQARNLVPGGLYTLWLFYFDQVNLPPPHGTGGLQPDLAFGGSSANVLVADMNGDLSGKQKLNFCPQRWSKTEQYQPLNLHLVLHPEGRVYGTVAEQLMKPPHEGGPGIVAIPHLMFTFPRVD